MEYDFGLTAQDYARHRAGFPAEFFDRVFADGTVNPNASLLDLGTGTGTLARGFAARGCSVMGMDISAQLIEQAKDLSLQQGLSVEFRLGKAEETGLPDESIDVVSAGQCWHWFDRPQAAREVKRLLKPGGTVLIAHFDWLPLPENVVDRTERLIQTYNPKWYERFGNKNGSYPDWFRDLREAGFEDVTSFSFDINVPYTAEAWRGRIRASAGVGGSLSAEEVVRFDSELKYLLEEMEQAQAESEAQKSSTLFVPHCVFVIHARKSKPNN